MPYRHYHDRSFHTHRRKSRGGRHFRAVCRRQRPWQVGFAFAVVAAVVLVVLEHGRSRRGHRGGAEHGPETRPRGKPGETGAGDGGRE